MVLDIPLMDMTWYGWASVHPWPESSIFHRVLPPLHKSKSQHKAMDSLLVLDLFWFEK